MHLRKKDKYHYRILFSMYNHLEGVRQKKFISNFLILLETIRQYHLFWLHRPKKNVFCFLEQWHNYSSAVNVVNCFKTLIWLVSRISPAKNISSTTEYTLNRKISVAKTIFLSKCFKYFVEVEDQIKFAHIMKKSLSIKQVYFHCLHINFLDLLIKNFNKVMYGFQIC